MSVAQTIALVAMVFTAIVEIIRAILKLVDIIDAWNERPASRVPAGAT